MVLAIAAFLDFCYIVRQPSLDEADLRALDAALERFCQYRSIFVTSGVCPEGISLPRQHYLQHYRRLIEQFGAPDGLSTSITESAHIDAVKKPWHRSSHFEELLQMLVTNQRMDKLAAFHSRLFGEGLLLAPLVPEGIQSIAMDVDCDDGTQINNSEMAVEAIVKFPDEPGVHCYHPMNKQKLYADSHYY
jgi:hypothetical protein